jgi:hypothetical protein
MNSNAKPIWRWIFLSGDHLERIVFLFISRKNANNARFIPLFEKTSKIRIVYFNGFNLLYTDTLTQYIFKLIILIFKYKIDKYNSVHMFSTQYNFKALNQILHIDDPNYDQKTVDSLIKWEKQRSLHGVNPIIICTNNFTKEWLNSVLTYTKVLVIEQGFHKIALERTIVKTNEFSCVYSSPYIDYKGDKHNKHSTYGCEILINEIIPGLYDADPTITIHMIGKVGKNAKKALERFPNIVMHGRVDFIENMQILKNAHIGIYPRLYDHKRSVLKIFTYMGAGLPVVTFELTDTSIVKQLDFGLSVNSIPDFISAVCELKKSPHLLNHYKSNILRVHESYTWVNLSKKMELLLN